MATTPMSSKRLTSYQRAKRSILFYQQRGEDLEEIIHALCRQIKALNVEPRIPLSGSIAGDRMLNDVSTGDFGMKLAIKYQPKP